MFLLSFSLLSGRASPADSAQGEFGPLDELVGFKRSATGDLYTVTPTVFQAGQGKTPFRRFDGDDSSRVANNRELTQDERQGLLDAHNHWRNEAALGNLNGGKKAVAMAKMYWDNELEEHAKAFSKYCHWDHSSNVGWSNLGYSYGENLFATSRDSGYNVVDAVTPLAEEHQYYDHDTGACSNPPCGHYTAIVWETTTRVGCAVTECSSIVGLPSSWGQATLVVCQYYRVGNWQGQLPYTYVQGGDQPGNGCPAGTDSQYTGLCANDNGICGDDNRCAAVQSQHRSLLPSIADRTSSF